MQADDGAVDNEDAIDAICNLKRLSLSINLQKGIIFARLNKRNTTTERNKDSEEEETNYVITVRRKIKIKK